MSTLDELKQCSTVPEIKDFVCKLTPRIGVLGGRYYSLNLGDSIPLNKVVKKLEKCYSDKENQEETLLCISEIRNLDKNSKPALKRKNYFIQFFTYIRQLIGNRQYPREKILENIESLAREKIAKAVPGPSKPPAPPTRGASLLKPDEIKSSTDPEKSDSRAGSTYGGQSSKPSSTYASVAAAAGSKVNTPVGSTYSTGTAAPHSRSTSPTSMRALPVPPMKPLEKLPPGPPPSITSPKAPPAPPPPRNLLSPPRRDPDPSEKKLDFKEELKKRGDKIKSLTAEDRTKRDKEKEKFIKKIKAQTVKGNLAGAFDAIKSRRKQIDGEDKDNLMAPIKNSDGWTFDPHMNIWEVSALYDVEFGEFGEFVETVVEYYTDKFDKDLPEVGEAGRIKLNSCFLEIVDKSKTEVKKIRIIYSD